MINEKAKKVVFFLDFLVPLYVVTHPENIMKTRHFIGKVAEKEKILLQGLKSKRIKLFLNRFFLFKL